MPRFTRFHSFLDRFEERMQVDCEQLKRQLIAQIDERFGILREKVAQLRSQFGLSGRRSVRAAHVLSDDPLVETVDLDEWKRASEESNRQNDPSPNRKRKSNSSTPGTSANKRQKTGNTPTNNNGSNKHQCKSPGCGKLFLKDNELARHERIHLGIKPFSCTWPDCRYSSETKPNVVQHVRGKHFKQKGQAHLNIMDNRNPEDYVRVDRELAQRRLE